MEMSFGSRLKHAWNAFTGNIQMNYRDLGMGYSYRADRPRMSRGNERSIVTSVYNRIALDVAALNVQHVRLDENGRFLSVIDDGLNNCLTLEANIDQTARSFIQDVVVSMFDEGSVAIVPVDTTTVLTCLVRMISVYSCRTNFRLVSAAYSRSCVQRTNGQKRRYCGAEKYSGYH